MPGIPPSWGVYFSVVDADAIVTKAEALGASVLVEPTDIPAGRLPYSPIRREQCST